MAEENIRKYVLDENSYANYEMYYRKLIELNARILQSGLTIKDLKKVRKKSKQKFSCKILTLVIFCCTILIIAIILKLPLIDGVINRALGIKCLVPNMYVIWEATRPITNCDICRNVNDVLILPNNISRKTFTKYAYLYKPMIVKGAALNWPALKTFDFDFFKNLYDDTENSYDSVDDECQFLNFKTDFRTLKEVFSMNRSRVLNIDGSAPWYVGWSNCHPIILEEMRKQYRKPHFLPKDAEHSHVDFIFMGYHEGAFTHLDYISRLLWQAQLRGHKLWHLNPPPECDSVCRSFSFVVETGDILLIDTRQWYHNTHVPNGDFSLTVSSEYG